MAPLSISVAVQHHPARRHLVQPLLARLPDGTEVVTDPNPDGVRSPFRTYLAALAATPRWATHRLIVQDDAYPCDGFTERLYAAVEERPDVMLALFVPGAAGHRRPMIQAQKLGQPWARLRTAWVPTVALLWPVEHVREFVRWAEGEGFEPDGIHRGDDGPVGRYCTRHRVSVWAPVPSLVQHPDVEPSLIGRRHGAGRNRARVAAAFDG